MKGVEHDVAFAFVILIGLVMLCLSAQNAWTDTPGAVVLAELAAQAEPPGIDFPELDASDIQFMEEVYQDRRSWVGAQWPYLWRFQLFYVTIALFIAGAISGIWGFGFFQKIPWKTIIWAVTIPYGVLSASMVLEIVRGSAILQGFWMCLAGGGFIVFGTVMMRPKAAS